MNIIATAVLMLQF